MSLADILTEIRNIISSPKIAVCCPKVPVALTGVTTGSAVSAAGDSMGDLVEIEVPKSGVIYSATYWDMDDEGTQVDFEVFKREITSTAWDGAWSPSDYDMLSFVTELSFSHFDDQINSQTSELTNIGKAYTAPEGKLWLQPVDRGTKNIAANNIPRIQLQILSDDPKWQER